MRSKHCYQQVREVSNHEKQIRPLLALSPQYLAQCNNKQFVDQV